MRLCLASTTSTKLTRSLMLIVIVLCAATFALGSITTYTGSDDGASTTGPWPNSSAAQTAFLAAAGPTTLVNFENVPVGFYSPVVPNSTVSISLSAPDFGNSFSGISNITNGNLYGFNITPGGSQWLGVPEGSATFNFASPVTAFGLWLTGVQTVFTSTFTLTFNDGTAETLNLPINVNGGTTYYAFTDTAAFGSITITNLSNDAWGIDDVSYSGTSSSTPEPSSLMLLGSGVIGLAGMLRRKLMR
jgi:hypothetical protein